MFAVWLWRVPLTGGGVILRLFSPYMVGFDVYYLLSILCRKEGAARMQQPVDSLLVFSPVWNFERTKKNLCCSTGGVCAFGGEYIGRSCVYVSFGACFV